MKFLKRLIIAPYIRQNPSIDHGVFGLVDLEAQRGRFEARRAEIGLGAQILAL